MLLRYLRVPLVHYGARYILASISAAAAESPPSNLMGRPTQNSRQILISRLKLSLLKVGAEVSWMLIQDMTHNRFPYRLVSYEAQYEYSVLADFVAAVFVPWNWELITFLEWFALGLPIFVPGPEFMVPLILHTLAAYPRLHPNSTTWANLRAEWSHGDLLPEVPEAIEDKAQWAANWYARTDYMRAPHVRRFTHFADLLLQIAGCDFDAWAEARRRANERAKAQAVRHYEALAERALSITWRGA